MATRRSLLGQVALGLGVMACRGLVAQPADRAHYVGVETSIATGLSRALFVSSSGERLGATDLDFRAHGMAQHGSVLAVFPRRPGNRVALARTDSLEILTVIDAPRGRHFFGHGAFTADGATLLVAENDLATLHGGVGVYETRAPFRRLGQIDLPGPGPHEIIRHPTRDLFFIALGGIETHPDYGRLPLNLDVFRSQILELDIRRSGVGEFGHWDGTEGISLRHLAFGADETLMIGGQLVDPERGRPTNILWQCRKGQGEIVTAGRLLAGYVSSVASRGDDTLVTSKEAHLALLLRDGEVVEATRVDGASAAALTSKTAVYSGYRRIEIGSTTLGTADGREFDNHGLALA
ncbi:MAG: DUF1513 domain-containing protein [Pseudomonadota bacterium]